MDLGDLESSAAVTETFLHHVLLAAAHTLF